MKRKLILITTIATLFLLTSCATIFTGTRAKVTLTNYGVTQPVNISVDGKTYVNKYLPCKVKVKRGYGPSLLLAETANHEPCSIYIHKKFNPVAVLNLLNLLGWSIDAATGAIMKPQFKTYALNFKEVEDNKEQIIKIVTENLESEHQVSRDNPGQTDLEQTIIRWNIDSEPRGARIFWRVISSVPAEVKNTNELYLTSTPYEETRSFNILGLTYENSRNVQIEIKLSKRGFHDQIKRYNVRQAIDQQEISSFFELVPISNPE